MTDSYRSKTWTSSIRFALRNPTDDPRWIAFGVGVLQAPSAIVLDALRFVEA